MCTLPPLQERLSKVLTKGLLVLCLFCLSIGLACTKRDADQARQGEKDLSEQTGVVFGRIQHEEGALGKRMSVGTVHIEWHHELSDEKFFEATAEDGTFLWKLPGGRYEITRLRIGFGSVDFRVGQGIRFRVIPGRTVYVGSLTYLPPAIHRAGGLDILDEYEMETGELTKQYPILKEKPPLSGLMFRLPPAGEGGMFVDAIINDRVLAPFLLDTGATHTIITRATALSLGIDDWDSFPWIDFSTSGGPTKSPLIEIDSLKVQHHEVEDLEVAVDTDEHLPFGLLGMNFLSHFRVVVDHQRQEIHLLR